MEFDRIEDNVIHLEPAKKQLYKCSFCFKSVPKELIFTNNKEGKDQRNICTSCAIGFKELLNGIV